MVSLLGRFPVKCHNTNLNTNKQLNSTLIPIIVFSLSSQHGAARKELCTHGGKNPAILKQYQKTGDDGKEVLELIQNIPEFNAKDPYRSIANKAKRC